MQRRPEVVYYTAVSVDGYLADGWTYAAHDPGFAAHYAGTDALLMGSHTCQQLQADGRWPYPGKPALVLSQRVLAATDPAVRIAALSVDDALDALAVQGARRVWLVGGGALASSVLSAGAISELDLRLVPAVLGRGVALFAGGSQPRQLELLERLEYPNGVIRQRYRVRAAQALQPPGGSGNP